MKLRFKLMMVAAITAMAFSSDAMGQDGGAVAGNAVVSAGAGCGTSCGPACGGVGCRQLGCRAGYNDGNCGPRPTAPCPEVAPSTDCIGAVGPHGRRYLNPVQAAALARRDHFSPEPHYAYGPAGLDATRMDYWNRQQAMQYSWHGNYNYWKYGTPTALVVPPTAAFQTEYNWGVAQTRTLPIYAQFGQAGGVMAGGVTGASPYPNTPYWPSSTSQFGIYPVRGPW